MKRRNGFTLLEIMFAIMILGVGLVAVASMFPVAAQVQASTIDDMMAQEAAANAKAMLRTRGIDKAIVGQNLSQVWLYPNTSAQIDLVNFNHLAEYSYPTSIPTIKDRHYFWNVVAMKRGTNLRAYVIVMKRRGPNPPQLVSRPATASSFKRPYKIQLGTVSDHMAFDVGSSVVDDLGNMYRILGVDRASGQLEISGRPDAGMGALWIGNQDTRGRGSTIRVFPVGGIPLR